MIGEGEHLGGGGGGGGFSSTQLPHVSISLHIRHPVVSDIGIQDRGESDCTQSLLTRLLNDQLQLHAMNITSSSSSDVINNYTSLPSSFPPSSSAHNISSTTSSSSAASSSLSPMFPLPCTILLATDRIHTFNRMHEFITNTLKCRLIHTHANLTDLLHPLQTPSNNDPPPPNHPLASPSPTPRPSYHTHGIEFRDPAINSNNNNNNLPPPNTNTKMSLKYFMEHGPSEWADGLLAAADIHLLGHALYFIGSADNTGEALSSYSMLIASLVMSSAVDYRDTQQLNPNYLNYLNYFIHDNNIDIVTTQSSEPTSIPSTSPTLAPTQLPTSTSNSASATQSNPNPNPYSNPNASPNLQPPSLPPLPPLMDYENEYLYWLPQCGKSFGSFTASKVYDHYPKDLQWNCTRHKYIVAPPLHPINTFISTWNLHIQPFSVVILTTHYVYIYHSILYTFCNPYIQLRICIYIHLCICM